MSESDIGDVFDAVVSKRDQLVIIATALADELNDVLAQLESEGVRAVSVIGQLEALSRGLRRDENRIRLNLEFGNKARE